MTAVPQVGQPASTYFTLVMSTPAAFSIGSADRLPAGAAEHDGLAFEALDVGRRLALAEGEVEHVGAAHLEDRDERNALRQAEREHARRRIAHVGLVLVDELHRGGRVRRARLERRLDVAEIAELLADPVGIVVEHLDRAARRYPADARSAA